MPMPRIDEAFCSHHDPSPAVVWHNHVYFFLPAASACVLALQAQRSSMGTPARACSSTPTVRTCYTTVAEQCQILVHFRAAEEKFNNATSSAVSAPVTSMTKGARKSVQPAEGALLSTQCQTNHIHSHSARGCNALWALAPVCLKAEGRLEQKTTHRVNVHSTSCPAGLHALRALDPSAHFACCLSGVKERSVRDTRA